MVKSWDCFDTLIARKYHYPKSIFNLIGNKINNNNFCNLRIQAEKTCHTKTLEGIYAELPGNSKDLELELEKEYTYPILENFSRINNGDIIVSDMYLSSVQILDILRHHGLDKDVVVYSTYGGKSSGKIWESIKNYHNIEYHIGDNLHSDVITPRKYGIKTQYYHNSNLTYNELLIERYIPYLAYWVKNVRLSNPYLFNKQSFVAPSSSLLYYFGNNWIEENNGTYNIYKLIKLENNLIKLYSPKLNSYINIYDNYYEKDNNIIESSPIVPSNSPHQDQRILWDEQAEFNIPLLINSIYGLPKYKDVVFTYRDCVYMKMLYDSINNTDSNILHTSRSAYYYPYNDEYIEYLKNTLNNKLVVDLHGTGKSSQSCFNKIGLTDTEILFVCEHCDKNNKNQEIKNFSMCFYPNIAETMEGTRYHHNKQASMMGLKCCRGTVLEKFNIYPGIGALVGWVDNMPYRRRCEHNAIICHTFDQCVRSACSVSKYYKDYIKFDNELLDLLLDNMYQNTYTNSVVHTLWDKK